MGKITILTVITKYPQLHQIEIQLVLLNLYYGWRTNENKILSSTIIC